MMPVSMLSVISFNRSLWFCFSAIGGVLLSKFTFGCFFSVREMVKLEIEKPPKLELGGQYKFIILVRLWRKRRIEEDLYFVR